MRLSRKTKLVAIVLLIAAGLILRPFLLTEMAVRKVLNDPLVFLSKAEWIRIYRYINGQRWHRLPGVAISSDRQARLVKAGIKRQVELSTAGGFMNQAMGEQWDDNGSFPTLPYAAGKAVLEGQPNADSILMAVAPAERGKIDPYIDVEFVMLSCDDEGVILACALRLDMETLYEHRRALFKMLRRQDIDVRCKSGVLEVILYEHRQACLEMLQPEDIGVGSKRGLLEKIVNENPAAKWFTGEEELLKYLRSLGDKSIDESIDRIEEQMRAALSEELKFKCLSCGHVFEMTLSEALENATEAEGPQRGPPQVCPKCNQPKALVAIPCPDCEELLTAEDILLIGTPLCPQCDGIPGR